MRISDWSSDVCSSDLDTQLAAVAPQVRMPGFRPGKVPANLVRKMHGPALEQEALQTAVQDSVQKLLADNKLRPAMQPSVDLARSEERRVGKECVSTCSSRWSPSH